jgi:hypothetical protein
MAGTPQGNADFDLLPASLRSRLLDESVRSLLEDNAPFINNKDSLFNVSHAAASTPHHDSKSRKAAEADQYRGHKRSHSNHIGQTPSQQSPHHSSPSPHVSRSSSQKSANPADGHGLKRQLRVPRGALHGFGFTLRGAMIPLFL